MKYLAIIFALVLFCAGCRSEATRASWEDMVVLRADIEADGIVTAEESAAFWEAGQVHAALEKEDWNATDWMEILAMGAGSVLASFLGVNAYRNRGMPGTTRKT